MSSRRTAVSVAMILACASGSAHGITIRSWSLSTGGSYSTATNWSPSGVPAADDNLIFDVPGTNSFVCDALVPVTGIQQWRGGTMNWSATTPHTVAGRFDIATLTGNVGTVRITSGELIVAGLLRVGLGSTAVGTLTVDGPNSLVTCPEGGQTFIGSPNARGFLNVTGGARFVSNRSLALDASSSLGSRVTVEGAGSTMTFLGATSNILGANQAGFANEIVVQNGGTITTEANVLLGAAPLRPGRLRVGDAAATLQSTLTIAGDLRLGETLTSQPGSLGSAEFLRMSMVSIAGDLYLGDPNQGPVCTMTINQNAGGAFAVSCRDFHLGPNGVLALERGRFNVSGALVVSTGDFVLDTASSTSGGFMVLSGPADLDTLRLGVAHNGILISSGALTCATSVTLGEDAGSFGQLDVHSGGTLTGGATLEVGRAGRGDYSTSGPGTSAVGELQIGTEVGGEGNVRIEGATFSCAQAQVGRVGGGSVATLTIDGGATYNCVGSTVINAGGEVSCAVGNYSSGRTILSGGTLTASGLLGGRIGGGSGFIIASRELTLGDASSTDGYETGAVLAVGENRVTALDQDRAIGSATIAGGVLDAANGWEVPAAGSLEGFGVVGECVAFGAVSPSESGLTFEGPATISGGLAGTSVSFNRGLTAEGLLNAQVFTAPGTVTTITGAATIGDGTSLGADLHGTLLTSDDALVLSDDDGVGGGDFSLVLGFGTVFADSIVRIDPGASLKGVGSVQTPRLFVGGDISPGMHDGDDIGTINTSAAMRPSGDFAHFHLDVAGAGEGQADAVYAGSGILLSSGPDGATLTVRQINGYTPTGGDRIQILGAAAISGEFQHLNLPPGWAVQYESNAVYLFYGCAADFNGDGGVDGDDVIGFFEAWDAGGIAADFNHDEGVDGDDVIQFFEHWDAGC